MSFTPYCILLLKKNGNNGNVQRNAIADDVVENSDEILDAVNSFMRVQRAPPESDSNNEAGTLDVSTTFHPRRPYNLLQSGGRIENEGAEQNGNENWWPRNVNSFDPTKYKTTICRFWRDSQCAYGEQCIFAHGQEELRNSNDSWEESTPTRILSLAPSQTGMSATAKATERKTQNAMRSKFFFTQNGKRNATA